MRMRNLWTKAGVLGSVSMAFGSMLWSQKKTETNQTGSNPACTEPPSPYELKLVQAQWVPNLLEPPAHTQINYVVTDLEGGPRPSSPVEDSYRANILTQLYELGERLRKRYIQDTAFLNPTFSPTEVYVRSTNIVRTIESAKCLVAGLFQQSQRDMVSILTTEAESEILYPNYHGCRLLKLLSGHRWAESSTLPDIAADLRSIQSALGIAAHQRVDFILIRDDMVARETHGLPCPPALDSWRNTVEQRAVEMICHIYEPSKRKLFLYSAHDTTLMPCLMALGEFKQAFSNYSLTSELYESLCNRTES
ncbi:unnamed protein product, partial [Coregonus sp. 'balchen']